MKNIVFVSLCVNLLFAMSCKETEDLRIACVGDSITEGSMQANQSKNSYPVLLDSILGDGYKVLNCGRGGATMMKSGNVPYWNCYELYNTFVYKPDVIIIKLGTNDSKTFQWDAHKYETDMQSMIDTFMTLPTNPVIYLCLPAPAFSDRWGISDSVITNSTIPIIKKIAGVNGLKVIDVNSQMKHLKDHFPDGIHPDVHATKIMAGIIANGLEF